VVLSLGLGVLASDDRRARTAERHVTLAHKLHIPDEFRRGATPESASDDVAVWLIEHMCSHLDLDNLGDSEVLDMGCGIKFTHALINRSLPIKRYVGIDVYKEMIDFLRENVDDPRFEYFHIDVHNERYNPDGDALSNDTRLPIGESRFDIISLFSVFTHLAPPDYRTMLRILRRYVKPDGRLFYTLYIDEDTEGGHGLMDVMRARIRRDAPVERIVEALAAGTGRIDTFSDLNPADPLKWAVYSERYARELIDGTGWEAVTLSPPTNQYIQHHFVCAPC
jgi:SAM-dependent methyltransferase